MSHGHGTTVLRNRLRESTSPYLLQHAAQPVDWWSWCPAAIEDARRRDVPIFLSIGYSTCYWCHVMARESFDSPEIAAVMNRHFVSIKVDREERPDVDEVFMTACQVFTRLTEGRPSGGWPLSAFLEPRTLRPFFVGTYFPPTPAHGRASFLQVLSALADAWESRRGEVIGQSTHLGDLVESELADLPRSADLADDLLARAVDSLLSIEDREHGGFGGAPKFPQPVFLRLLEAGAVDRPAVAGAIERALDGMSLGGLHDHVGGGMHRYAVDATWTVPHFEKMLYDQGQLAVALAASLARTGDPDRARTLERMLAWMLEEMRVPGGAFASALDAEVDAREGASYLWTPEEVASRLREAGRGDLLASMPAALGLDRPANFRDPHHPDDPPAWVLRLSERPDRLAARQGRSLDEVHEALDETAAILLAARRRRPQPGRDDKVIAGWNGLAITGLASGAATLGGRGGRFLDAAVEVAESLLRSHWRDGVLWRLPNGPRGFLEDHALLAEGLVALGRELRRRRDPRADGFLANARAIADAAEVRFGDARGGGWFDAEAGQGDLFVRARRIDDGAVPSGAGTLMLVLLDLAALQGDRGLLDRVERALAWTSGAIAANPLGACLSVIAADRLRRLDPARSLRRQPSAEDAPPVRARLEPAAPLSGRAGDAEATIVVEIDPPHHVNAHVPGEDGLLGLEVRPGSPALEVEASYPPGDLYRERLRVHAREVRVPVRLRRRDASPARLEVIVQPCTDRFCLPPLRLEVLVP